MADGSGAHASVAVTEQERIESVLTEGGLEIYRSSAGTVQIAERVRMHLMDSGVAVSCDQGAGGQRSVMVTFRCQRSDFPLATADALHERIVQSVSTEASRAGFSPRQRTSRKITNPVDDTDLLDVWFEVTYGRDVNDDVALRAAVVWAMQMPKCITP